MQEDKQNGRPHFLKSFFQNLVLKKNIYIYVYHIFLEHLINYLE